MPNWVHNALTVTGDAELLARFVERAVGDGPNYYVEPAMIEYYGYRPSHAPQALDFDRFVPVPLAVRQRGFSEAGFEWEADHWGLKWGACEVERERPSPWVARYTFRTPWSAPRVWLRQVAVQWPALTFRLESWSWESDFALAAVYERGAERLEYDVGHPEIREWMRTHKPDVYAEYYEERDA